MLRRLFILVLILLSLVYIYSGYYFYKKSFLRNTINTQSAELALPDTSHLAALVENYWDFEDLNSESTFHSSSDIKYEGNKSLAINPEKEFEGESVRKISTIPSWKYIREVEVTMMVFTKEKSEEPILWVVEIDSDSGKVVSWDSKNIQPVPGKWERITFRYPVKKETLHENYRIKTYAWNKNKRKLFIDNLQVIFIGFGSQDSGKEIKNNLKQTTFYFSLEDDSCLKKTASFTNEKFYSRNRSSLMNGKNTYSVTVYKRLGDVISDTLKKVTASVWLYPEEENSECFLTMEVRSESDDLIYWNGRSTKKMKLKAGQWQKVNTGFDIDPEDYRKFHSGDFFNFYIKNTSRVKIYSDDFKISFNMNDMVRGGHSFADMNSTSGGAYSFIRNRPPYPLHFMNYVEMNEEENPFPLHVKNKPSGEILAGQHFLTGNFTGQSSAKDELLALGKTSNALYVFCSSQKRFILLGYPDFGQSLSDAQTIVSGDFNGDGKTDILVMRPEQSVLFQIANSTLDKCADNKNKLLVKSLWQGIIHSDKMHYLSGNFLGNKASELFAANENGDCKILQFTGNEWKTVNETTVTPSPFVKKSNLLAGKFLTGKYDVVLSIYEENNSGEILIIYSENNKLITKKYFNDKAKEPVFSPDDKLYPVLIRNENKQALLSFNNRWKNEFKCIVLDENGFYVKSTIDFTGNPHKWNPKFYEGIKIVTGNFTGPFNTALFILFNCADINYNGLNCNVYETNPSLPNSVQLYSFPE